MMWSWNIKFTLNGIFNLDDDENECDEIYTFAICVRMAYPMPPLYFLKNLKKDALQNLESPLKFKIKPKLVVMIFIL